MRVLILAACLVMAACTRPTPPPSDTPVPGPLPAVERTPIGDLPDINAPALLAHAKVLSSDQFEGRAPGTKGEALTVSYLIDQFQRMGLEPGNTDGTFVQKVPLVAVSTEASPLLVKLGTEELALQPGDDLIAITRRQVHTVSVQDLEVVFVGYGVVAPDGRRDDYGSVDVSGKVVVMLSGIPPDAAGSASSDSGTGTSDSQTPAPEHWSAKFKVALEKGAAAAFVVNESGPTPYPPAERRGAWTGERLDLIAREDGTSALLQVEGWLSVDAATRLLSVAGQDLESLKARAASPEFQPVPLGLTSSITLRNTLRRLESSNVLAKIAGRDPVLRGEHVVFMAHWDQLGVGEPVDGDSIYNGAVDNAVGVGGLLETARAFVRLSERPRRSILFLAVTGEHQGQLGARHYAISPTYPLDTTAAVINMDTLNVHGRTRDVTVVGLEHSALEGYVREAAGEQGRIVRTTGGLQTAAHPRGVHALFAEKHVPSLNPLPGAEYLGKPPEFIEGLRTANGASAPPSDTVRSDWDLSGAREDLKVFFAVGYRVAEADERPALELQDGGLEKNGAAPTK